jgi:hypothetical protein
MVISPVVRRRNLLLCAFRNPSRVVQDWPEAGTNCRSSVQIRHSPGGASELRAAGGADEGWHEVRIRSPRWLAPAGLLVRRPEPLEPLR